MLRHLAAICALVLSATPAGAQQDPTVGAPDQLSSPGTTTATGGGLGDLPGAGGMDPDGVRRHQALDQQQDTLRDPTGNRNQMDDTLRPPDPQLPGPRTDTFELPGGQPPNAPPAGAGSADGLGERSGDGGVGRGSGLGGSR